MPSSVVMLIEQRCKKYEGNDKLHQKYHSASKNTHQYNLYKFVEKQKMLPCFKKYYSMYIVSQKSYNP